MSQTIDPAVVEQVNPLADRARGPPDGSPCSRGQKDAALHPLADALVAATASRRGQRRGPRARPRNGMTEGLQDRLRLDERRVAAVAQALRDVAALPDPVGEIVRGSTLANGLQIRQVRVPMGVVGMIYEARPNVTVDAAGLGLKSGNAVILRGGSAAATATTRSSRRCANPLRHRDPPRAIILLEEGGRDAARALMTARGRVDLVIPRGGADLIQTVVTESTVPVIETGVGVCHVYVDRAADLDKAAAIASTPRPTGPACATRPSPSSSTATSPPTSCPRRSPTSPRRASTSTSRPSWRVTRKRPARHTTSRPSRTSAPSGLARDERADRRRPRRGDGPHPPFGTGHTEAIVTEDRAAARRFTSEVDAAAVMVNASSRFTDGGEFGFGAEIGISTQKLHARGPMALPELTTTKWIVEGDGQIRVSIPRPDR